MNVTVSEVVRDEFNGLAQWYDAQPSKYGRAFLEEVQVALSAIEQNPRAHPPAEDGRPGCEDREYFIERFKQRVIFTVEGDDVYIHTVAHANRRPGSWHRQASSDN